MKKGYFITFEGGDGAGKSTQITLLRDKLENRGFDVLLTREPGGTSISEKIREIILDKSNSEMDCMTEAMLYAASRAQLVSQVIRPAIDAGRVVICDRFVDSSIAYQAYGRGLGESVSLINSFATGNTVPDLTFLLKVDPAIGSSRISNRDQDRIEMASEEFHMNVYRGYLELEKMYPERIVGIDACRSINEISEIIADKINLLLEKQ